MIERAGDDLLLTVMEGPRIFTNTTGKGGAMEEDACFLWPWPRGGALASALSLLMGTCHVTVSSHKGRWECSLALS